ncbi:MAG TPA: hypothetical protein VF520_02710 [Thermoleophilaceae bacterium]|jgi:hypothetical protein
MELTRGGQAVVVVDESGQIIAAGPRPEDVERPDGDGPHYLGIEPLDGQEVHVVDLPALSSVEELHRVLSSHRVRVVDGKPRLEPVRGT